MYKQQKNVIANHNNEHVSRRPGIRHIPTTKQDADFPTRSRLSSQLDFAAQAPTHAACAPASRLAQHPVSGIGTHAPPTPAPNHTRPTSIHPGLRPYLHLHSLCMWGRGKNPRHAQGWTGLGDFQQPRHPQRPGTQRRSDTITRAIASFSSGVTSRLSWQRRKQRPGPSR